MGYGGEFDGRSESLGGKIVQMFNSEMLDESECRLYLLRALRPEPICPYCSCMFEADLVEQMQQRDRQVTCRHCARKSSPRAGTAIEGVHATYRQIILVAIMLHWQIPPAEISRCTGVSSDTVRRFYDRLIR